MAKFHASGEPPQWLKDAADKADAKLKWLSNEAYELARVIGRTK